MNETPRGFGYAVFGAVIEGMDVVDKIAGVKTVTTSAGSPKKIYPKIKEMGMRALHVLLAAPLAIKATEAGVDGVVATGVESGGLRTTGPESSNMILIPLICDMVDVPVVAAGGIADRRSYRAALALGAQGVQIGTRFLASEESPASMAWKEAILACGDGHIVATRRRCSLTSIVSAPSDN